MGDRRSCFAGCSLLAFAFAAALATAQMSPAEKQGVTDALYLGNLTVKDLEFERKLFSDPYRLSLVNLALDKPLQASDSIMAMHAGAKSWPVSQIADFACRSIWPQMTPAMPSDGVAVDVPGNVPASMRKPLGAMVKWMQRTNSEIRNALGGITPEQKRQLIDGLPGLAVEEPGVVFDFVKSKPLGKRELFALLRKIDVSRICRAGVELSAAIEKIVPQLRGADSYAGPAIRFQVGEVSVCLAGSGSDDHSGASPSLLIDLGGNDRYAGRVGSGIGFASVVLDLGGDDVANCGDLGMGSGLLGVGIAKFAGGSSRFSGGSLCFGSGLAGFGAFAKEGSSDVYQATALSEGFGMFGVGLLVDNSGDDTYRLAVLGQGGARTMGVGWLIDRRGADVYRAGGLIVNSPLFKTVTYSFAQGYAGGYREDSGGESGGIGLLTDFSGDDAYLADTYAQAASYWFALGSLYDAAGNDTYSGYHYVQSSAMHLTAAYLFDLEGDDGYMTKYGACHAIGHDYGVALLLDRSGNDVYASQDSNPGTGNANGVGIFVDAEGNDRYSAAPGLGNAARGTGSLGVFVDLVGTDKYREGLTDGGASVLSTWGVALDQANPLQPIDTAPEEAMWPKQGSASMRSDSEMATLYARAGQWGVGTAQADVDRALRDLVAIGLPAWDWMLAKRVATATHLEIRAFQVVLGQLGTPARVKLAEALGIAGESAASNLLRIATLDRTREAAFPIAERLKNPTLLRTAVRAAGACGGEECVRELLPLTIHEDPVVASSAVIALADIGSESGYSTAEALIASPDVMIRKASIRLMAGFTTRALATAKRLLGSNEETSMRFGLELLGATGTNDALNEACKYLSSGIAGVKIQALLALAGRCPADSVSTFRTAKSDPNPLVKAIASRLVATK